jgi:hypothetical protein
VSGAVDGTLPVAYSAWTSLKAFELSNTQLTGTIPVLYTTSWPSLENFTLDGASVSGLVPDPSGWSNLTWYTLQNTQVFANAAQPFWLLKNQSATLQKLRGLRIGELQTGPGCNDYIMVCGCRSHAASPAANLFTYKEHLLHV